MKAVYAFFSASVFFYEKINSPERNVANPGGRSIVAAEKCL